MHLSLIHKCHVIELKNCRLTSSLNISEFATRCQNWLITNPTISIKHGCMRCQTGKTLTKWSLYFFYATTPCILYIQHG